MTPAQLRAIDAQIAEHVMGWTHIGEVWTYPGECGSTVFRACYGKPPLTKPTEDWDRLDTCGVPAGRDATADDDEEVVNGASVYAMEVVPRYSSDIAAAWQVVERMAAEGFAWSLDSNPLARYRACFTKREQHDSEMVVGGSNAEPVSLAICLAALAAKGVKVEVGT